MRTPGIREQLRRRLYIVAHREVSDLLRSLPPTVRDHAATLPVLYEMTPRPYLTRYGIAPDTLGLFTGSSFAEGTSSTTVEPTQIILFMENIWEYVGHDSPAFREEIRRTYLHELGHYLGLDEDDLATRDLD